MAIKLSFNDQEYKKFRKALHKAARQIDDLSIPLADIADRFMHSRRYIFDKGRRSPGMYKDLSEKYKPVKQRKFKFIYPILLGTGRLRKSVIQRGAENITKVSRKSLILGTKVPYGADHQRGRPSKRLPARPFLFWGPEAPRNANKQLTTELHKQMARTLFIFIERKLGKALPAAITTADRKVRNIFK